MFERFSDQGHQVVVRAQEEARRLRHNHIGTEHLLLGVLCLPSGAGAEALGALGVSLDAVRRDVEEIIGRGDREPEQRIPFTPRAKRTLELANRMAKRTGAPVGSEHLLMAVADEGDGVGAQVLHKRGVTSARLRGRLPAESAQGERDELAAPVWGRRRRELTARITELTTRMAALRDENARLREEIARLRAVLAANGVDDPGATAD